MLIEFIGYNRYLGTNKSERHYGAVVMAPTAAPQWVSLGAATTLSRTSNNVCNRCATPVATSHWNWRCKRCIGNSAAGPSGSPGEAPGP